MQQFVPPNRTSRPIPVLLRDPATALGVTGLTTSTATFAYVRAAAAGAHSVISFTPAVFQEVDSVRAPGLYVFELPPEARDPGSEWVVVYVQATGAAHEAVQLQLDADAAFRRPGNHRNEV